MENIKIGALRKALGENKIDVYYLNTSDYHLSEYVPLYFKTIEYFSGFTGSLATFLIDLNKAYIFVDGRYHIQADKQCLPNGVEVIKLGTKEALDPLDFIEKNYKGKVIGIDGKRTSIAFAKELLIRGMRVKSIDLYSNLIENRIPLSKDKLYELSVSNVGLSRKEKIERVKYCLDNKTHDL